MHVVESHRLTTEGARHVLEAALAFASEAGMKVTVVVADAGGHPLVIERMEGAAAHTVRTATTKEACAASMRRPTGVASIGVAMDYGLGIALAEGGSGWTPLPGGVPIIVGGECIGSVGVSGAPGEVDEQIAEAGVRSL